MFLSKTLHKETVNMNIKVKKVPSPRPDHSGEPVMLSDETIEQRKQKLLKLMKDNGLSSLIVYADKEHGSNFEYLTGFIPRFEEGLQILNQNSHSPLILINDNFNKIKFSRVKSEVVHCPLLSLPNQPMNNFKSIHTYLEQVNIDNSSKIRLVGWKLLSKDFDDFHHNFDLPAFIVGACQDVFGKEKLVNATQVYMHPG